jgi:hypothetical protein
MIAARSLFAIAVPSSKSTNSTPRLAKPFGKGSLSGRLTPRPSKPTPAHFPGSMLAECLQSRRVAELKNPRLEVTLEMPKGDKGAYTGKQKRQAEHIEESYEERGVSSEEAEKRAWATVNKESGGGKKSGSGRGKKGNKSASKKGGKKGGKKAAKKSSAKKGSSKKR